MSLLPNAWTTQGTMDISKFVGWLTGQKDLYTGNSVSSAEEGDRVWNAIMTSDSETATMK